MVGLEKEMVSVRVKSVEGQGSHGETWFSQLWDWVSNSQREIHSGTGTGRDTVQREVKIMD
jgi:hypothetical protein